KPSTVSVITLDADKAAIIVQDSTADQGEQFNWARFQELVMNNVRIGIINEKLQALQNFASTIINYHDIHLIFGTLLEFLLGREKFGCQDAFIYYVDKNREIKTWGSLNLLKKFLEGESQLPDPAKLAELFTKHSQGHKLLLPIKVNNSISGLVGIVLLKRELEITEGNTIISEIYGKIFRSALHLTAIAIENAYARESLFLQSIMDPLTGAYNRRYLEAKLTEEIARAKRYKRHLSLVLIDLNNFKEINDKHGHNEGDLILKQIAEAIIKSIRGVDTLARYGGDEFIILMPETSNENAKKKIQILKNKIKETPFELSNTQKALHISISAGLATLKKNEEKTSDQLIKEVDKNMYKDKFSSR
ncbi:MAG: GGDEF domain-containing protein, partial [Planctomycetes bacterium]|nr:GGDEF domain-containing protein [Planctomycetota bacterium]